MALVNNNYYPNNPNNFSVRGSVGGANREPPLRTGHVIPSDASDFASSIPPNFLLNHTLVVRPTTQTIYYLPTASQILSEFGRSADNGVSKLTPGTIIPFNVVNRGIANASIALTGSANVGVWCPTGAASLNNTGDSVTKLGKVTTVYLEWLAVNSGVNGATGEYTIYSS